MHLVLGCVDYDLRVNGTFVFFLLALHLVLWLTRHAKLAICFKTDGMFSYF